MFAKKALLRLGHRDKAIRDRTVPTRSHRQQTCHEGVVSHALFVGPRLQGYLASKAMKRVNSLRMNQRSYPCPAFLDNVTRSHYHFIPIADAEFLGFSGINPQAVLPLNLIQ